MADEGGPKKRSEFPKRKGHIVIIGGGKLGQNLMRDLPKSLLIESGPVKTYWLSREFGEDRVLLGDGADVEKLKVASVNKAEAIIITTAVDTVNYKIALAVSSISTGKVMVRVQDEESFRTYRALGMEPFKITPAMSAKIIDRILRPEAIHIHEFILPAKCGAIGQKVEELDLPDDVKFVSVLRGDHLEVPEPNLVLEEGDIITAMATEEDVLEIRKSLGARLDLNPLQKIYVPYKGKQTVKQALREAFILAKYANAEVTLLFDKNNLKHKKDTKELEQMFKLQNVAIRLEGIEDIVDKGLKSFLKGAEKSFDEDIGREIPHLDIVMMDPVKSTGFEIFTGLTRMRKVLEGIDCPVLVAGNMNPYKSMLMLIDSSEHSDPQVSLAIDLAILFGSKVHVLVDTGGEMEDIDRLVKYVTRAGRLYGLDITIQNIEGNPSLEMVERVRSDQFDLVVVNWRCQTIKRDIVRRTIEYGPRTVLIIP